jgi:Asp-tRNA(Asn)/Glu-tRNA(Gln) amidotransferase B subunit
MKTRDVVDTVLDNVIHGHRENLVNDQWERQLHSDWVKFPPPDIWYGVDYILSKMGIGVDFIRAKEFDNLAEGKYPVYYYLGVASHDVGDEAFKWIMSALAAELNERGMEATSLEYIMPAQVLNDFCKKLLSQSFDRNFAKQIFSELLNGHDLDELINDPRFKSIDSDSIDVILDEIIANNPDQFDKAKANPKLIQWFVGQMMKATQGKSTPSVVIEKMTERLKNGI